MLTTSRRLPPVVGVARGSVGGVGGVVSVAATLSK